MKNELAVHTQSNDANGPVVCFDEKSKQLVGEVCTPIPSLAGRAQCHDLRIRLQRHGEPVHAGRTDAWPAHMLRHLRFDGACATMVHDLLKRPFELLVLDSSPSTL